MKDWFYDEYRHVGVDYAEPDNADVYDGQMDFRDYGAEVEALIDRIGLGDPSRLVAVDLGCGTGAFTIHAARRFQTVYAVDVSDAMQGIARDKAADAGLDNVEFVRAGFLGFMPPQPVDVVNSKWALHHLPDYWKQVALVSVNRMLRPGGVFALTDVIFRSGTDPVEGVEALLKELAGRHDPEFVEECKLHVREEFSTFDWIMRGMVERAGFEVVRADMDEEISSELICRKVVAL